MKDIKQKQSLLGAIFGVAVGDALGAPLEFMEAEEINRRHGRVTEMIGGGWLNVRPGEVTDDTQMTLCVARGIIENPEDPVEAIGAEFVKWYQSGPKDIGGTCAGSIHRAMETAEETAAWSTKDRPSKFDWTDAAEQTDAVMGGRSGGNGSLMRTVYVGMFYDSAEIRDKAIDISRMTHWDIEAGRICALYCEIIDAVSKIRGYANGVRYFEFKDAIRNSKFSEALEPGFIPRPSGWVVDSFRAAIWAISKARRECTSDKALFRAAMENAVNLGGDADTIGAITGGLAGAICRFSTIPRSWLEKLDKETTIELYDLAERASEASKMRYLDLNSAP